ncbi:UDP-N-acetylmuramoyl-tripeptide--D-alanyl-D-alanine ligase, partial [Streptomyces sp. NPDC127091]
MIALSLAEIAEVVGGQTYDIPDPSVQVTGGVVRDARGAGPGRRFVALGGGHVVGPVVAGAGGVGGAAAGGGGRPG